MKMSFPDSEQKWLIPNGGELQAPEKQRSLGGELANAHRLRLPTLGQCLSSLAMLSFTAEVWLTHNG